jgi:Mn2+/Fe2+ NRAMP family transporter
MPMASTRLVPRRTPPRHCVRLPVGRRFLLFSLGIVGTGLLAIPALAGSAAYAIAETFGWKRSLGLRPQRAPAFYLVIGGATLVGSLGAMTPINPITMLVWSAMFNGIVAAPLMVGMMLVVTNRRIMGEICRLVRFGDLRLAGDAAHGPRRRRSPGDDSDRLNAPQVSTMPA